MALAAAGASTCRISPRGWDVPTRLKVSSGSGLNPTADQTVLEAGYICGAFGFCCQRARRVPEGSSKMAKDRKSTRLNSSHLVISYAVFCLKKKKKPNRTVYINLLKRP